MKKRRLEIRLVKDDGPRTTTFHNPNETNLDITMDNFVYAAERVIKTVGIAVVGHVVLDTVRQVLVAKATHHHK